MPWWLWILASLILYAGLVLLDRALSRFESNIEFGEHRGAATGTLSIYLPGLVAHGDDSSRTVLQTWLKYGDVLTVSYTGERFNAADVIKNVVMRLRVDVGHDQFVFIGSSMGGLLAVDIIDQLRKDGNTATVAASSIIFVDSPSGSRDMLSGGNIGAPVLRFLPIGRAFNWLHLPMVPPKDKNIEDLLDRDTIKAQAIKDMKKFPTSVWRDQLAYMAAHPALRASNFSGLGQLIYLMCDRVVDGVQQNETVKQPQAAETWRNFVRGLLVIGINSPHCGYLERPRTWNQHFEKVLQNVTARH